MYYEISRKGDALTFLCTNGCIYDIAYHPATKKILLEALQACEEKTITFCLNVRLLSSVFPPKETIAFDMGIASRVLEKLYAAEELPWRIAGMEILEVNKKGNVSSVGKFTSEESVVWYDLMYLHECMAVEKDVEELIEEPEEVDELDALEAEFPLITDKTSGISIREPGLVLDIEELLKNE